MGVEAPLPGSVQCSSLPTAAFQGGQRRSGGGTAATFYSTPAPHRRPAGGISRARQPPQKTSENLKTSLRLRKGVKIGGSSELLPNHFLLETLARQTSSCCVCVWASKDPSSWQNLKFEPQSKPQDQSDWHCCLETRFPPKHGE